MRELIGHVGVDSGQLMVCDPCYIDSQWKQHRDMLPRRYQRPMAEGGEHLVLEQGKDFLRFDEPVKDVWGHPTMNQLIKDHGWTQMREAPSKEFSYRGCCEATLSPEGAGGLDYSAGHTGAGVAFSSGYGDGVYPVYATRDEEGNIVKVEIEMGDQQ